MYRKDILFYKDNTGKMIGIAVDQDFKELAEKDRKAVINECKEYAIDILSRRKWARNILKENGLHEFPLEVLNNMFPLLPKEIQKYKETKNELADQVIFYECREGDLNDMHYGVSVYDGGDNKNIYLRNFMRILSDLYSSDNKGGCEI